MKTIKQIISLFLIFVMALSFVGCGANPVQEAEKTVNETLSALKALDPQVLGKFLGAGTDEEIILTEDTEKLLKPFFSAFEYEIVSSEKMGDDTVYVQTKITTVDMALTIQNSLLESLGSDIFLEMTEADEEELTKKMEELLLESLSSPDVATVTTEVLITVVKKDGKWEIEMNEILSNTLFGGMKEAFESPSSSGM